MFGARQSRRIWSELYLSMHDAEKDCNLMVENDIVRDLGLGVWSWIVQEDMERIMQGRYDAKKGCDLVVEDNVVKDFNKDWVFGA